MWPGAGAGAEGFKADRGNLDRLNGTRPLPLPDRLTSRRPRDAPTRHAEAGASARSAPRGPALNSSHLMK